MPSEAHPPRKWTPPIISPLIKRVYRSFLIVLTVLVTACQPVDATQQPIVPPSDMTFEQAIAQGNWQQALYILHQMTAQTAWTPTQHQQARDLWQAIGQPDRAYYHAQQYALSQTNLDALRQLAENRIQAHDWRDAHAWLTQLHQQRPFDTWANLQLALILAPSDPIQASRHLADISLADVSADDRDLILTLLPFLQRPEEQTPLLVGQLLAQAGYFAHAENAFSHAGDVLYPNPIPRIYWALMRVQQGKPFATVLQQSLEQIPDEPLDDVAQLHRVAGLTYRLAGMFEASLHQWHIALALSADNPFDLAQIAMIHALQGDITIARAIYEQARQRASQMDESHWLPMIQTLEDQTIDLLPDEWLAQIFSPTQKGAPEHTDAPSQKDATP